MDTKNYQRKIQSRVVKKASPATRECLRIIPLGGMEEVGRNMVIFEYLNPGSVRNGDIIIVDMGLQFPEENMPGIDYIIPNISYLLPRKNKIRGLIISHAHFDHIGAVPHLIPQLGQNIPIYGTDLTTAVIAKRQEDFQTQSVQNLNLKIVDNNSKLELGIFQIEFFGVSHNIPGSLGTIIKTPLGIIVHTGDYKLDLKSDIAGKTDIEKIRELGKKEVLALMSDSTNAREPGYQFSEKEIKKELEDIVKNTKGRLIIGTFASLLGRLNQIIALAEKHKKKLVIDGRSMKTNIEIGRRLGYIKYNPKSVIPIQEIHKYPPEKIIILVTGAQGEGKAVLMRIVNKEHKYLRIEPGDTVVFSSSVIPGNERSVQNLTDKLYRDGAEVINYRMLDIHAGGHAKQEELKEMIKMINPKYLIPIEGLHYFLKMHAKLAIEDGFPNDNILIADNGQVIEASDKKMHLTKEYAPANYIMVDGLGIGDVKEVVLRDRQMLSEDGIFVVITVIDSQTGKVKGSPDIISRGFVYLRESQELLRETRRLIIKIIEETAGQMHPINWTYVKDNLRDRIGKFLFKKTERRPMVLPVVIEV